MGRVITNDVSEIGLNIKRFLARMVDWGIYILICNWILFSVFNLFYLPMDEILNILLGSHAYFSYIIMILIEPLLLRFFGTTPGKFIFGLYVNTVNGNKLSYRKGLSRAGGVFFYGMGLGIPLVNVVCGIVCYVKVKKKQMLPWESGNMMIEKKRKWWLSGLSILFVVLCLFAAELIERNAMLPVNRGTDISKEELLENYEAYLRVFGVEGAPELMIEQKDGEIINVSFEIEKERAFKNMLAESDYDKVAISAFMAFVGAQDNINYSLVTEERMLNLYGYSVLAGGFEFNTADITVSAYIDKEGYNEEAAAVGIGLVPIEGEKQSYYLKFVMKRKSTVELKPESTTVLKTGYNKANTTGDYPAGTQSFFVSDSGEDIYIFDILNQDILHYRNNILMNTVNYGTEEGSLVYPYDIAVTSDLYYVLLNNNKLLAIEKDGKIRKEYSLPKLSPERKTMTLTEKGLVFINEPGRWCVLKDDTILDTGYPYRYAYDSSSTDERLILSNETNLTKVELRIGGDPGIEQIRDYKDYSLIKTTDSYQAEDGTMQVDEWLCLVDDYGIISKIQIPESLHSDEYINKDIFALPNGNIYKLRLTDDQVEIILIADINK